MSFIIDMLSYRKGANSLYRPEVGWRCLVSGPNCDDSNGYTYAEMEVLWKDDTFVAVRSHGCWPVVYKWEHIRCKPLTGGTE